MPPRIMEPGSPYAALARVAFAAATLFALLGCSLPPEPMPGPARRPGAAAPAVSAREAPWNLTLPEQTLAIVPGAAAPTSIPQAVRRTAALATRLLDASAPVEERADYLLGVARSTCALGGYGLPLAPVERQQIARQAVIFFDLVHPEISGALSPPWAYHLLRLDEFKTLPPEAIIGWAEGLRLSDLNDLLTSGGCIVLLKRLLPSRLQTTDGGSQVQQPTLPFLRRKDWALVAVWLPDQRTLTAVDVVEVSPPADP